METKLIGFRSKSSQRISANCSGVISVSFTISGVYLENDSLVSDLIFHWDGLLFWESLNLRSDHLGNGGDKVDRIQI